MKKKKLKKDNATKKKKAEMSDSKNPAKKGEKRKTK